MREPGTVVLKLAMKREMCRHSPVTQRVSAPGGGGSTGTRLEPSRVKKCGALQGDTSSHEAIKISSLSSTAAAVEVGAVLVPKRTQRAVEKKLQLPLDSQSLP